VTEYFFERAESCLKVICQLLIYLNVSNSKMIKENQRETHIINVILCIFLEWLLLWSPEFCTTNTTARNTKL